MEGSLDKRPNNVAPPQQTTEIAYILSTTNKPNTADGMIVDEDIPM
jgi:hypothetical protein